MSLDNLHFLHLASIHLKLETFSDEFNCSYMISK